jgi:hypothetical protein
MVHDGVQDDGYSSEEDTKELIHLIVSSLNDIETRVKLLEDKVFVGRE